MNRPARFERRAPPALGNLLNATDPRVRLLTAIGWAIAAVWASSLQSVAILAAAAVLCVALSGIPLATVLRRAAAINFVFAVITLVFGLVGKGPDRYQLGPLAFSAEGLTLGVLTALKGNAIVLSTMALIGSIPPVTLGHALDHLRVPVKLSHLFLFTVRYIEVLREEYVRLRAAMKVRGFRPRMDRHTYRSLGYLAGMVLIRALERSERIEAAMKCRGFRGRFYLLDHFALSFRDVPLIVGAIACLAAVIAAEYRIW